MKPNEASGDERFTEGSGLETQRIREDMQIYPTVSDQMIKTVLIVYISGLHTGGCPMFFKYLMLL